MTFQEAAKKTGVASRMDKGLRIYKDKFGAWSSEGTLDNIDETHTDWVPAVFPTNPDEHILTLLKETRQQLDKLIKLTENYI